MRILTDERIEELEAFWDEQCAQPLNIDRTQLPF